MMRMGSRLTLVLFACLLLFGVTFAGSASNFNRSFLVGSSGISIMPQNFSFEFTNASPGAINDAANYIANRLGKGYYDSYIENGFLSIYNARYYPSLNLSYVYFSYDPALSNGTKITDFNLTEGCCSIFPSSPLFAAVVLANNGSVLYYAGPSKPYSINISYNDALNITEGAGLNASHGASLVAGSFNPYNSSSGYLIAWAVRANQSPKTPGTGIGVYINAETGNVLGEFYWGSSPGGTLPGSPEPTMYTLGNYSIFPINNSNSYVKSDNVFLISLLIIAIMLIAITVFAYKLIKAKK